MRVNKELKVIRELLSLTQEDLALNIGVSLDTISRWENEKTEIEEKNIDAIYNYALEKGININKIYEQIFYEDCEKIKVIGTTSEEKRRFSKPLAKGEAYFSDGVGLKKIKVVK